MINIQIDVWMDPFFPDLLILYFLFPSKIENCVNTNPPKDFYIPPKNLILFRRKYFEDINKDTIMNNDNEKYIQNKHYDIVCSLN